MKIRALIGPAIAILVPYLLFELLRRSPVDLEYIAPRGHFYIVSSASLLAVVLGVAIGVVGSRIRNLKVCFLALSFISLAEIFAVHGLSTPGFILEVTHVPGISAQVSVMLATFWLWLSILPPDHKLMKRLSGWKHLLVPVWSILLGIFGIVGFSFPHLVDLVPFDHNPLKGSVTALVVGMNAITMYSYFRSYQYSRFPLQISVVYSCGWFIVAQVIITFGVTWHISWWLYHFILLASMLAMVAGLLKQHAVNRSLTGTFQALFSTDPVERITSAISPSVRALILATESKDTYTAGHNFRVTLYALRIGEEMGLPPEQLRALVQGSIVHDVGKINIPDSILNKPGKLDDEERTVIESHPVKGFEMCRHLGFMTDELNVIRHHHEKWDGSGYPDRLAGEQIPLLARIVAVADVYDALTSNRAYRKAWTHEAAIGLINDGENSHFDAACVRAWNRVCESDPQIYKYPNIEFGNEPCTITDLKSVNAERV